MNNILISSSILSADFFCLGKEVENVLLAGSDLIHFDVMDNHYVPNLTFGPIILESLRKNNITVPIEVHLMINPLSDNLIVEFYRAGASCIIIHPETTEHLDKSLRFIKNLGCKVGLALNPSTPLNYLDYVIDQLDVILLMSVNPGFGGQSFLRSSYQKIKDIKKIILSNKKNILLEIDGGVNIKNVSKIISCGVDVIILGSSIFRSCNYKKTIQDFRNKFFI